MEVSEFDTEISLAYKYAHWIKFPNVFINTYDPLDTDVPTIPDTNLYIEPVIDTIAVAINQNKNINDIYEEIQIYIDADDFENLYYMTIIYMISGLEINVFLIEVLKNIQKLLRLVSQQHKEQVISDITSFKFGRASIAVSSTLDSIFLNWVQTTYMELIENDDARADVINKINTTLAETIPQPYTQPELEERKITYYTKPIGDPIKFIENIHLTKYVPYVQYNKNVSGKDFFSIQKICKFTGDVTTVTTSSIADMEKTPSTRASIVSGEDRYIGTRMERASMSLGIRNDIGPKINLNYIVEQGIPGEPLAGKSLFTSKSTGVVNFWDIDTLHKKHLIETILKMSPMNDPEIIYMPIYVGNELYPTSHISLVLAELNPKLGEISINIRGYERVLIFERLKQVLGDVISSELYTTLRMGGVFYVPNMVYDDVTFLDLILNNIIASYFMFFYESSRAYPSAVKNNYHFKTLLDLPDEVEDDGRIPSGVSIQIYNRKHDKHVKAKTGPPILIGNPQITKLLGLDERNLDKFPQYYSRTRKDVLQHSLIYKPGVSMWASDGQIEFEKDSDFLEINLTKVTNLGTLSRFMKIFSRLLTIYKNDRDSIIKIYSDIYEPIKEISTVVKKVVTISKKEENKIYSYLFLRGYNRLCSNIPSPMDKSEYVSENEMEFSIAGLKSDLAPKDDVIPLVCRTAQAPYPGLVINNSLGNKTDYPLIPCCFSEPSVSDNNPYDYWVRTPMGLMLASQYMQRYTTGGTQNDDNFLELIPYSMMEDRYSGTKATSLRDLEDMTIVKNIPNKLLLPCWTGEVPLEIKTIFGSCGYDVYRKGVPVGNSSLIHLALMATRDDDYFSLRTRFNQEEYVHDIRGYMADMDLGVLSQEMYDVDVENIREILKNDYHLDTSLFYRIIEEYFDINLIGFIILTNKVVPEVPRFCYERTTFNSRTFRPYRPTIFYLKHWGNMIDPINSPHFELLVTVPNLDEIVVDLFGALANKVQTTFGVQERTHVNSIMDYSQLEELKNFGDFELLSKIYEIYNKFHNPLTIAINSISHVNNSIIESDISKRAMKPVFVGLHSIDYEVAFTKWRTMDEFLPDKLKGKILIPNIFPIAQYIDTCGKMRGLLLVRVDPEGTNNTNLLVNKFPRVGNVSIPLGLDPISLPVTPMATVIFPPGQPINLPVATKIFNGDVRIIVKLLGQPKNTHVKNKKVHGIWYDIGGDPNEAGIYVPIIPSTYVKIIKLPRLPPGEYTQSSIESVDKLDDIQSIFNTASNKSIIKSGNQLTRHIKIKKDSEILLRVVMWLYLIFRKIVFTEKTMLSVMQNRKKSISKMKKEIAQIRVGEFSRFIGVSDITEDSENFYHLDNVAAGFPDISAYLIDINPEGFRIAMESVKNNSDLVMDSDPITVTSSIGTSVTVPYVIFLPSNHVFYGIQYLLMKYEENYAYFDVKIPATLSDMYTDIEFIKFTKDKFMFSKLDNFIRWSSSLNVDRVMYSNTIGVFNRVTSDILNRVEPYIYILDVDGANYIYLIQNVKFGDKGRAIHLVKYWKEYGKNLGYEVEQFEDDPNVIIYSITPSLKILPMKKYGEDPYVEILEYTPSKYGAMLLM